MQRRKAWRWRWRRPSLLLFQQLLLFLLLFFQFPLLRFDDAFGDPLGRILRLEEKLPQV